MGRLRQLAGRPFADRERRGAFWAAAIALVCAAALLLALPGAGKRGYVVPELPAAPHGQLDRVPAPRPAPASGPVAATRRFLSGYLPFIYGQGPARAIRAVAPSLAARLARSRLRVPPAARERDPLATRLEGQRMRDGRVAVTARIEDGGVAAYPILLTIARHGGRWLVVSVGVD